MGVYIPNMEKPLSCDECRILRAEFDGSYDKPITGCRQKMGKKNTLQEEWDALIPDCPLIDIVTCGECKHWYNDADCGMACEFTNMKQPSDGFCNWGERIDEYEREYRELGLYELRELRKIDAND